MTKPRIAFFGCTQLGYKVLEDLLYQDLVDLKAIVTTPESFSISYSKVPVKNSTFADFSQLDRKGAEIVSYDRSDVTNATLQEFLRPLNLDIIIVVGWFYMVPKTIRDLAKNGAWGIHASLLPLYAGGAPLVWAMINGEKEAGVTLFELADGVDDGFIIGQEAFPIDSSETIADVLIKAEVASKKVISSALKSYPDISRRHQDLSLQKIWPQRSPDDGFIDTKKTAKEIFDFIRAQTKPYPMAFLKGSDGRKVYIEKAHLGPEVT